MNAPARSQARSAARLAAVQALYQLQMEGTALAKLLDEFHQHRLGREVDDEDHEGEVFADAEVDFFDEWNSQRETIECSAIDLVLHACLVVRRKKKERKRRWQVEERRKRRIRRKQ